MRALLAPMMVLCVACGATSNVPTEPAGDAAAGAEDAALSPAARAGVDRCERWIPARLTCTAPDAGPVSGAGCGFGGRYLLPLPDCIALAAASAEVPPGERGRLPAVLAACDVRRFPAIPAAAVAAGCTLNVDAACGVPADRAYPPGFVAGVVLNVARTGRCW